MFLIDKRQVIYSLAYDFIVARKALNLWAKRRSWLNIINKDFWAEQKAIDPEHTLVVIRVNIW